MDDYSRVGEVAREFFGEDNVSGPDVALMCRHAESYVNVLPRVGLIDYYGGPDARADAEKLSALLKEENIILTPRRRFSIA